MLGRIKESTPDGRRRVPPNDRCRETGSAETGGSHVGVLSVFPLIWSDAVNICHSIDSSYSTGLAAATQTRVRLSRMTVLEWLLDSDPAIRWQVLGDLAVA